MAYTPMWYHSLVNTSAIYYHAIRKDAYYNGWYFQTGNGTALSLAFYGQGTGSIWLDDVGCVGNESRLWDCINNGIGIHNCLHSDDASVQCSSGLSCGHQGVLIIVIYNERSSIHKYS